MCRFDWIHAWSRQARAGVFALALILMMSANAAFADYPIKLVRGKTADQIPQLKIFARPEMSQVTVGENIEEYVTINGSFSQEDWSLISGKTKLKTNKEGKFKMRLKLTGPQKTVVLAAVAPDGTVKTEAIKIYYPDWKQKRVPRWSLSAGMGVSYLNYSETGTSDIRSTNLTEIGLTGKISYQYRIAPPLWDLGLSMFGTLFAPIASINQEDADPSQSGSVRFLGINARIGYVVPAVKEPWRVILMGGFYYTSMYPSVNGALNQFGFKNMMGPQFFPVIRRALENGDSVSAYLKYSPVSSGGIALNNFGSSREIAIGSTYSLKLNNGHYLPISLDISNLKTDIEDDIASPFPGVIPDSVEFNHVNLTSVTLSVGYTF